MQALFIACMAIVAALSAAEYNRARTFQFIFKPLAALGFILIALGGGAIYWSPGLIILWALLACAAGDLLLLPRERPHLFKIGMAAFALGHGLYVAAFIGAFSAPVWAGLGLIAMGIAAGLTYRTLKPGLPEDMRWPVIIYMGIISLMVAAALGTGQTIWICAAIMFAVSDIFVARDRFIAERPVNALFITPLYFGAQGLFALSAAIA